MTVAGGHGAGSDAESAWRAVRDSGDVQFAPLPPLEPVPPSEVPAWQRFLGRVLEAAGDFLAAIFGPVGRTMGMSWPVFQYVLIALAACLLAYLCWHLAQPLLARWRDRAAPDPVPDWAPHREEALALLADADRLAAQGQFAEATHLLLLRSVHQIAQARPELLHPASTAREIAGLAVLPQRGREAFAVIARHVESSLFAMRHLDGCDWAAARAAYADFARMELRS